MWNPVASDWPLFDILYAANQPWTHGLPFFAAMVRLDELMLIDAGCLDADL